jgi:hypothetical protein
VLVYPELSGLILRHLVEDFDTAGSADKGAGASSIIDRGFSAICLANMMFDANGCVSLIGNVGKFLRYNINGTVVVFGHVVTGNERINYENVDFIFLDRRYELFNDRLINLRPALALLGKNYRGVAPTAPLLPPR